MTWEIVQFEEMERMKEELEGVGRNDIFKNYADNNLELPPTFLPNLLLVLRLTASYLIPSIVILFTIIASDKDIPYIIFPNAIIALDKAIPLNPVLVLIIAPDKAFALASNA